MTGISIPTEKGAGYWCCIALYLTACVQDALSHFISSLNKQRDEASDPPDRGPNCERIVALGQGPRRLYSANLRYGQCSVEHPTLRMSQEASPKV